MKEGKAGLLAMAALLTVCSVKSQLTGIKNIPGDYATLAAAITDLNAQGVGPGGVTLNVIAANPQAAPIGGYSITATGTLANPIVITGNNNTVTAPNPQTAGSLNDAIFKIIGGDYITLQGFTMQEHTLNSTTTAINNDMTEFGVALFYASPTNGAQNNTIQNNIISLKRIYQNTFGIYSNVTHSSTDMSTLADITSASGSNSNNKVYFNNISSVNEGMVFVGSLNWVYMDSGLDIGGISQGNTISDFGSTVTFSSFQSVNASVNGIYTNNQLNVNVSYNNITSSAGSVTGTGTIRGIFCHTTGVLPVTGVYNKTVSYNNIAIKGGNTANSLDGIRLNDLNQISSFSISNNDFHDFNLPTGGTGGINFIVTQSAAVQNATISNNTFTGMTGANTVNTSGSINFINKSGPHPENAVITVNNNSIVTGFTKRPGGTIAAYSGAAAPSSATETCSGNNFSNISVSGTAATTTIILWNVTFGSGSLPFGASKTITNNTFTNISNSGSSGGAITILGVGGSSSANISGNFISDVSGVAAVTGILVSTNGNHDLFNNDIHTLSTTGAALVAGMAIANGQMLNIYKNKIYDLSGNNTGSTVDGISITTTTPFTTNIYNNLIGDLRAPIANAANPLTGINITSVPSNTNLKVSFNTIYLNAASTGPNFGSSGIFHTVSTSASDAALTLQNNIIVNTSTPLGTGLTVAYRRSGTILNNYVLASNNNLFYAGTPGPNRLIFYDGTNSDQSLAAFQARMVTRDGNSITELPPFLSTAGLSANFLHIDPAVATQTESGGISVAGITDDFDANSRNANLPDIGADEFSGTLSDATGPVISYTALYNTTSTSNKVVVTTITDVAGVGSGASAPRIYYRKGTSGAYFAAVATSVAGNNYTFTIDYTNVTGGSVAAGDIIQYYIAAQDVTGNLTTNPFGGSGITPPGVNPPITPNQYKISQAYTWQGATNDFQLGSNWSPNRATPDASDILIFDGSVTATTTANNIPTQTVTRVIFQNNVNATLNSAVASNTLTLDYAKDQTVLDVQAGSTCNVGATTSLNLAYGLTQPGQIVTIAGTLNLDQLSVFNTANGIANVTGAVGMGGSSLINGSTMTSLAFAGGSFLNVSKNSGAVPVANYHANSIINITGLTGTSLTWPGTPNNVFGSITWNCTAQTGSLIIPGVTLTGSLVVQNTNTGSFGLSADATIAGDATINNGTWNIPNANLTILGNLIQNGGTILKTGALARSWLASSVNQVAGTLSMAAANGLFTLNASSGNMTFAGTVNGGTGTGGLALTFSGTGSQTLNTTGAAVSGKAGIIVSKNSGTCTLLSDFTVNAGASVTFNGGKLTIAANKTLTIASGASALYPTVANYFVSDVSGANIGKLKYSGLTTVAQSFAVGTANYYLPVTITPNTPGSSFAIGVFEGATQDGVPNSAPITSPDINDIVNAEWQIDNSVVSTPATIYLNWPTSLEGSNFATLSNPEIGIHRYNGSNYDLATGSGDNVANTATSTFSSFSPFIVGRIGSSCGTAATWTGTIDNDYNKPGNWSTGCVPTATTNVIIPSGTPTLTAGSVSAKNITMSAGATLNLNDGAILNVKGDFVNDGTVASGGSPGSGKTVFNGAVAQNVSGSGVYSHVEIDNTIDVTVITDIYVQTMITLPGAKLTVTTSKTVNVLQ